MSMPSQPAQSDRIFTIDEAADYLAIPKATLYTWRTRRAGYGPRAMKVGGSLRYRRSDLDVWILEHLESGDSESEGAHSLRGKAPDPQAGVTMTRRRLRN